MFRILKELESAETRAQKLSITQQISKNLTKNEDFVTNFVKNTIFVHVKHFFPDKIGEETFYDVEVFPYVDEKGFNRLSLGVVFVQNLTSVQNGLENIVLEKIVEILTKKNLQFLVNDINVNSVQRLL